MISNIQDFFTQSRPFVELFNAFAKKHSLPGNAKADHICYKCDSRESFEKLHTLFEYESEYMYQSIISKRPIAIIKFKTPIETDLGPIWYLELSDQKPDASQKDGFDHIEVYATSGSYDDMVTKLKASENVIEVIRPHHSTHDIDIGSGFLFRCTQGPLIEKIKSEEMK